MAPTSFESQEPKAPLHANRGYYQPDDYSYDPQPVPRKRSKWLTLGLPALLLLILLGVGLGVGLGLGLKNNDSTNNAAGSSSNQNAAAASSKASSAKASTTAMAAATAATSAASSPSASSSASSSSAGTPPSLTAQAIACGQSTFTPSTTGQWSGNGDVAADVRPGHPRMIMTPERVSCITDQAKTDTYLSSWMSTIMNQATTLAALPTVQYVVDGTNGLLDVSRQVQLRLKMWAFAYRFTNDTQWVDRSWQELLVASGNSSTNFPDWHPAQFLDTAEMTAAFAISYDWLYDAWTPAQRDAIMWSIINRGLNEGQSQWQNPPFWTSTQGNWNCVCNGGMGLGSLAIMGDDPTGISYTMNNLSMQNFNNCVGAPQSDGSWTETANYWYFGSQPTAQYLDALTTVMGTEFGLLNLNPGLALSGLYHMYVNGTTQLFDYGDAGPNKYTATANPLLYYGNHFQNPIYTLFQRDAHDAPDPMSMFWYNNSATGDWWSGLDLQHEFPSALNQFAVMRSSWTDPAATYFAIKAGALQGHQTHNNLDDGDFVFDAMGVRWAGELGSQNYNSYQYFSSQSQDATRWIYYRDRTEGQNTLMIDTANQDVDAAPTINYGGSDDSSAFFTMDMSSAYPGTGSVMRGGRFVNQRREVLIQDEITKAAGNVAWLMHTNATITPNGQTANLAIGSQSLVATIVSPTDGSASFSVRQPVRLNSDPSLPNQVNSTDTPNPGVSVLTVTLNSGVTTSLQVVLSPQYPGFTADQYWKPVSVPLSGWTLTSHGN